MLKNLVLKSRSYRRFDPTYSVDRATLRELVDLARLSPSGMNMQSLKYILAAEPELNARIFPTLIWARYLRKWPGPAEGERPTAYIIILNDTAIQTNSGCDYGIAAQTIMLGAAEKGLGGCMIGSIKQRALRTALNIPGQYEILLVLALGKPAETVVLETIGTDGDVRYWRDEADVHHVPKRTLDEIIID